MAFTAYLPARYAHLHESQMFDALVESLKAEFENKPGQHCLVGNPMFDGQDLDALFVKRDGVCVIEMKDYGGTIHFSEIGDWTANGSVVKGGTHGNPFRQVRKYKFALLEFLLRNKGRFLKPERDDEWDISGMVLFGKPVSFTEMLPMTVSPWFHICDQWSVGPKLAGLRGRYLRLDDNEIAGLIHCLDLRAAHVYQVGGPQPTAEAVVQPPIAATVLRFQVIYHHKSPFREALLRHRAAAGARMLGAMKLIELFGQVGRGRNPFGEFKANAEPRIENAFVYSLNPQTTYLAIVPQPHLHFPWFIATPQEVEDWIAGNKGFSLAVEAGSGRITPTTVLKVPAPEDLKPQADFTEENRPYLARLSELELDALVPQPFIREGLAGLDENSSDQRIMDVVSAVRAPDIEAFLFSLISMLRAGDLTGAQARVKLRNSGACPVEDAGAFAQKAVESDANSDQIIVINNLDAGGMEQFLNLQDWMLLLHRDQKKVAEGHFDKPVVLTGVSGSGKTCILVHRARFLARTYPNERIGVLTLNRKLTQLLKNLINQRCNYEERRNIHVMAFYDYFRLLLHELRPDKYLEQLSDLAGPDANLHTVIRQLNRQNLAREFDNRSSENVETDTFREFFHDQNPSVKEWLDGPIKYLEGRRIDAARYLKEEFTLIRSAFTTAERSQGYLEFERKGRTESFDKQLRRDILQLLLIYEERLLAGELLDVSELTQACMPLLRELRELPPEKRFRCLLIDEFQDFSTLDLKLLRWLPTGTRDGLFLAGDPVQKIMVKRLRLNEAFLDAPGSADGVKIKRNYRNSRQILRAASVLASHYGNLANGSGEEIEFIDPELAARETAKPVVMGTNNQIAKAWEIAREVAACEQTRAWTTCIASADPAKIKLEWIHHACPADLEANVLRGDYILRKPSKVVVASIHDIKGFEFNLVIILGCAEGVFPSDEVPDGEQWRDALRLYVAMTRARDQVTLLYEGQPSPFLKTMQEHVKWEHSTAKPPALPPDFHSTSHSKAVLPRPVIPSLRDSDNDGTCCSWFSATESDLLHRYFAKFVFEKEVGPDVTFREWLTPENLQDLDPARFLKLRNYNRRHLESLSKTLWRCGVQFKLPK